MPRRRFLGEVSGFLLAGLVRLAGDLPRVNLAGPVAVLPWVGLVGLEPVPRAESVGPAVAAVLRAGLAGLGRDG